MSELRAGLPPLPPRMAELPVDKRGYPVPFFVATVNGEPDHRVARAEALDLCLRHNLCWLCGQPLDTRFRAFCIGPMCAITRTTAEPPQHLECSTFAAKACPFLTRPHAKRREVALPEDGYAPPGEMIRRNPGAVCVWVTVSFRPFRVGKGLLFRVGPPSWLYWFAEGRPATREEVDASITSGLPLLRERAEADGDEGRQELAHSVAELTRLLDATVPPSTTAEAAA